MQKWEIARTRCPCWSKRDPSSRFEIAFDRVAYYPLTDDQESSFHRIEILKLVDQSKPVSWYQLWIRK